MFPGIAAPLGSAMLVNGLGSTFLGFHLLYPGGIVYQLTIPQGLAGNSVLLFQDAIDFLFGDAAGDVTAALNRFMAFAVWKYRYDKDRRAEYEPENTKLEIVLTVFTSIGARVLHDFLVGDGLTYAHVQRNLGDARHLHLVRQAELLLDLVDQLVLVLFL